MPRINMGTGLKARRIKTRFKRTGKKPRGVPPSSTGPAMYVTNAQYVENSNLVHITFSRPPVFGSFVGWILTVNGVQGFGGVLDSVQGTDAYFLMNVSMSAADTVAIIYADSVGNTTDNLGNALASYTNADVPAYPPEIAWGAAASPAYITDGRLTNQQFLVQNPGVGNPVFTTDGNLLLPDWEGVYSAPGAGGAPVYGARKVMNRAWNSQDFSQSSWTVSNATKTTGQTDPNGGDTAVRITATAANGRLRAGIGGSSTVAEYVNSIWLRRVTGTGPVRLVTPDSSTSVTVTDEIDGTWRRFTCSDGGNANGSAYIGVSVSVSGDEVEVAFAQMEDITGQSNQAPGDYIPTEASAVTAYYCNENGNTVLDNVVTEAVGPALAEQPWLYAQPAATNILLNSRVSEGAWAPTGVTVDPGTTMAPDGTMTADTLTEDTSTARHNTQAVTTQLALDTVHTHSVFLKPNGRDWVRVYNRAEDGTGLFAWFNISTGTVGGTENVQDAAIVPVGNGWYRASYNYNSGAADTTVSLCGYWLSADGVNTDYPGDGVSGAFIWGAQLEQASHVSAPIITEGSAVTVAANVIEYDIANHDSTEGAYYFEYQDWQGSVTRTQVDGMMGWAAVVARGFYVSTVVNRTQFRPNSNTQVITSWPADTPVKVAGAFTNTEGDFQSQNVNGLWSADDVYTGFNVSAGYIQPLSYRESPGLIRNIRRYDLPYAEAKAKIDELML